MIIEIILMLINVTGFIIIAVDKQKAIKHKWRVPEKTLLIIAFLGGSVGVYTGMIVFRHKTKHLKFMAGVPGIILLQLLLVWKVL
jgi:uncharacterized membrane protein YsdA (DUF1294 family)